MLKMIKITGRHFSLAVAKCYGQTSSLSIAREVEVAIFSLNHKPISKSKHPAGRTGSHVRYISRSGASPVILTNGISKDWREAKAWFDDQEQTDRKNARIADRVMVALPRELNHIERAKLIQDYLAELTGNQIPWYVAIHQEGPDQNNPHAHILIRDRSLSDGRRIVKTSERGSTTLLREKWAERANIALQEAGINETIDHRSYAEQGIEKEPSKHLGPEQKKWRYRLRKENGRKNDVPRAYL